MYFDIYFSNVFENFLEWIKKFRSHIDIIIIDDKTVSNETRIGAIGDMDLTVKSEKIDDDLLIVGGDNLFSFDLKKFVEYGKQKQGCILGLYNIDKKIAKGKYGIVQIDAENIITNFEEKPEDPKTTLAAMCL